MTFLYSNTESSQRFHLAECSQCWSEIRGISQDHITITVTESVKGIQEHDKRDGDKCANEELD